MNRAATLLILIALGMSGCRALTERSGGACDQLVGWYRLPDRHRKTREVIPAPGTLIPVFKIDGGYYSVCRGFEIPLKECPEGLEWAFTPSSMIGTTIGLDKRSKQPFIGIVDSKLEHMDQFYIGGEKQTMTRIEKPSWLLDATAECPRTNDDFLGCYQPAWMPAVAWEIRKEGESYLVAERQLQETGVWKTRDDADELTPLPDRLGFTGFDRKNTISLTYNKTLKRFELVKGKSCTIRMPLTRVEPEPSSQGDAAALQRMRIGIPSWH